ncbi:MAG: FAD:protein FMN transferase [Bacteroidota bacterium]
MLRRIFLVLLVFLYAFTGISQERFVFTQPKMGSPFTIILYENDSTRASAIASASFVLVDSLVNIFSDYIDSSELNRLSARAGTEGEEMQVSEPLLEIMLQARLAYESSMGMFDITLGPLTRLWRKARKDKVFPTNNEVKRRLALTGFKNININAERKTVSLTKKGMSLDLGGIAQGYIAGKVINYLEKNEIKAALVDVSGDIMTLGAPPGTEGWTIGINVPGEEGRLLPQNISIRGQAVTTSGDLYQFMEHKGKRYSHVLNPTTGYGITSQRNVTVISPDPTQADWLTKACSLLPIKAAKVLVKRFGAELLIVENPHGKLNAVTSTGFSNFWKKRDLEKD